MAIGTYDQAIAQEETIVNDTSKQSKIFFIHHYIYLLTKI